MIFFRPRFPWSVTKVSVHLPMHPGNRLAVRRYLESQDYRRRINAQLNKGESLHALRDFLFVADKGVIHRKQEEAQTNLAMCLNLVINAVVVWNTVYMQAVLDQLRREGTPRPQW
jgi:TnpA family transposase